MIDDSNADETGEREPYNETEIINVYTEIANAAILHNTVASRLSEALKCLRTAADHDQEFWLREISVALRDAGDGSHDHARAVEKFWRP